MAASYQLWWEAQNDAVLDILAQVIRDAMCRGPLVTANFCRRSSSSEEFSSWVVLRAALISTEKLNGLRDS